MSGMDPNRALTMIRRILRAPEVDAEDVAEQADAFGQLDGWLSVGGELPAEWERRGELRRLCNDNNGLALACERASSEQRELGG
jgi:hypothetical protein